ncbi:unnamed protein product, partial [Lampetra fluviatilis]
ALRAPPHTSMGDASLLTATTTAKEKDEGSHPGEIQQEDEDGGGGGTAQTRVPSALLKEVVPPGLQDSSPLLKRPPIDAYDKPGLVGSDHEGDALPVCASAEPPQVKLAASGRTGGLPATDLGPAGDPPVPTAKAARSSGLPADASPVTPPTAPLGAPTLADVPAARPLPAGTPPVPTTGAARGGGPVANTRSRGMRSH